MRKAFETKPTLSEAEAVKVIDNCLKVLFYRDARSWNKVRKRSISHVQLLCFRVHVSIFVTFLVRTSRCDETRSNSEGSDFVEDQLGDRKNREVSSSWNKITSFNVRKLFFLINFPSCFFFAGVTSERIEMDFGELRNCSCDC